MMSALMHRTEQGPTTAQANNRRIGTWLTKLSSYLTFTRDFREQSDAERAEFWAELILVMAGAELPTTVWNADAIRFCRRRFKFFPSAAELCEALNAYAEPIRAAAREHWQRQRLAPASALQTGYDLTPKDQSFLKGWQENNTDGFRQLAVGRGTTPEEARRSSLSLLNQQCPQLYQRLMEGEQHHA